MHFLCLHGMGTNVPIFQLQTSMIRHLLGPDHTYDWVEGSHDTSPAPGMDRLLSSSAPSEFFAFISSDPDHLAESAYTALQDLSEYVVAEGPFDGVIAFSQGAGLAASLMIQQAQRSATKALLDPVFKCAVFFSGGIPGDPTSLRFDERTGKVDGEVRTMNHTDDGVVIHVPTVHIWGRNDRVYPDFGPVLAQLCDEGSREEVIWDGGHEIPGLGGKAGVEESVEAIKRMVERVQEGQ